MLNQPYPSGHELRTEARVDALLAEQEQAQAQFHAAILALHKVFDGLHFPICSPVENYDIKDISAVLADLALPQQPSDADIGYFYRQCLDEDAGP